MMLVGRAGVRAANDGNFPKIYGEMDKTVFRKRSAVGCGENDGADDSDHHHELQRR